MINEVVQGVLIPFLGTSLGAGCVLLMRNRFSLLLQRILIGFAGGVMVAASIWSLLLPAIEQSRTMGRLAFVPASVGFLMGIAFLLALERIIQHLQLNNMNNCETKEGGINLKSSLMMVLAVTLHNIPEGMAVGVGFASYITENSGLNLAGAMAISVGIAIQNFPEGAIISMPLKAQGMKKSHAFLYGVLSGVVEPVSAVITILVAGLLIPIIPYLLSFAAGAMFYVVIEELIPEMSYGQHSEVGTVLFAVGFTLMMALDVAFG